jgi:sterol desaturase/sphingolipid hydroxylase (fatty acid hydroxylase superfamily)
MKSSNDRNKPLSSGSDDAWLARPSTIRLLWWVFAVVLAVSVAVQLMFKVKGYFGVDGWLGFGAVYGFLACLAMVLFAKLLGWFLKRNEDYYRERDRD